MVILNLVLNDSQDVDVLHILSQKPEHHTGMRVIFFEMTVCMNVSVYLCLLEPLKGIICCLR